MAGAMLSKSFIQFSVDGWSCVASLLFIWGHTMVEVMKIMVTSLKISHACTALLTAPNPASGHHQPTLSLETLDTYRQVQDSLLWGNCSFILASGAKGSVVLSKRLFPSPV